MMRQRLAIVTTHPVQYYAPLYRTLAATPGMEVEVFFAHRPTASEQGIGFGVPFEWDVDVTGGFPHRFLTNRARRPNVERFDGCDTPEIADLLSLGRFDAVMVMGWHVRSLWQAMRSAWRSGTPLLVRGDSQLLNDRPVKRAVKRVLYPIFVKRFAACLAVGIRSAEYFRHYGARCIVHSPHFVDNGAFGAAADGLMSERRAIRAAWGIPDDAFVALFAGKFIPLKRPLDVLEAVGQLRDGGVHAVFAGDGQLRGQLEARARALAVSAHFAGFLNQSEMPRAYAASDVLVLPSARETWGLVVNEAMASGRPVIVSNAAGCTPDLVVDGRTGHSLPVGDVMRLARYLRALAADHDRAGAMGAAARRHVAAYSVDAAAAGVVEAMDGARRG